MKNNQTLISKLFNHLWLPKNKWLRWLFIGFGAMLVLYQVLNIVFSLKTTEDYSTVISTNKGQVIHAYLNSTDKWRMKITDAELSELLQKMVLAKEDKWFYWHFGVNPMAVFRAAFKNILKQKTTSGASTITMQVARMLSPASRTYGHKMVEIFRAIQLESKYSKNEILQLYLNLVPYGGNIEGVKAASVLYFNKMPNNLSPTQLTLLCIIPNRPNSLKVGNNAELKKACNRWLTYFYKAQIFTKTEYLDALNESIIYKRLAAPNFIPHYARLLKNQNPKVWNISTMLDFEMQQKVEKLAYNYIKRQQTININNAAVLIIDNKTRQIVSYVGSADYNDIVHQGNVNGINAVRSPGSTLKPIIYALAMDKGYITPQTIVADVPIDISGYMPENFDEQYNGEVSVEKALINSLNIPAVKTLEKIELATLINTLEKADFKQIKKDRNKLGLSTALGGCGTTLAELTNMYATLANYGEYKPLNSLITDSGTQIFSAESAYMVSQMLCQLTRPDLPYTASSSYKIPKIAWKTGTSYGRRDAWAIGYNARYTVGVWVGNFNGQGQPELTGADKATPLLFQIFNIVDYNSSAHWFTEPKGLDRRLVCASTGLPPNSYCTSLVSDYYIIGVSDSRICNHLQNVYVNANESISYCTSCLPATGYKTKSYNNISPEVLTYYYTRGLNSTLPPPHNASCNRVFSDNALVITSPSKNKKYLLEKAENQQLMLLSQCATDVQTVYWYLNDRLIATTKATEKVFYTPEAGIQNITCTDDKGRSVKISVEVSLY